MINKVVSILPNSHHEDWDISPLLRGFLIELGVESSLIDKNANQLITHAGRQIESNYQEYIAATRTIQQHYTDLQQLEIFQSKVREFQNILRSRPSKTKNYSNCHMRTNMEDGVSEVIKHMENIFTLNDPEISHSVITGQDSYPFEKAISLVSIQEVLKRASILGLAQENVAIDIMDFLSGLSIIDLAGLPLQQITQIINDPELIDDFRHDLELIIRSYADINSTAIKEIVESIIGHIWESKKCAKKIFPQLAFDRPKTLSICQRLTNNIQLSGQEEFLLNAEILEDACDIFDDLINYFTHHPDEVPDVLFVHNFFSMHVAPTASIALHSFFKVLNSATTNPLTRIVAIHHDFFDTRSHVYMTEQFKRIRRICEPSILQDILNVYHAVLNTRDRNKVRDIYGFTSVIIYNPEDFSLVSPYQKKHINAYREMLNSKERRVSPIDLVNIVRSLDPAFREIPVETFLKTKEVEKIESIAQALFSELLRIQCIDYEGKIISNAISKKLTSLVEPFHIYSDALSAFLKEPEYGIPLDAKICDQGTRTVKRKRIELAIELVANYNNKIDKHNERHPDNQKSYLYLVCFGKKNVDDDRIGYNVAALKLFAQAKHCEKYIKFIGEQVSGREPDNLEENLFSFETIYQASDVFTFFSSEEGYGNNLNEAIKFIPNAETIEFLASLLNVDKRQQRKLSITDKHDFRLIMDGIYDKLRNISLDTPEALRKEIGKDKYQDLLSWIQNNPNLKPAVGFVGGTGLEYRVYREDIESTGILLQKIHRHQVGIDPVHDSQLTNYIFTVQDVVSNLYQRLNSPEYGLVNLIDCVLNFYHEMNSISYEQMIEIYRPLVE